MVQFRKFNICSFVEYTKFLHARGVSIRSPRCTRFYGCARKPMSPPAMIPLWSGALTSNRQLWWRALSLLLFSLTPQGVPQSVLPESAGTYSSLPLTKVTKIERPFIPTFVRVRSSSFRDFSVECPQDFLFYCSDWPVEVLCGAVVTVSREED